MMGAGEWGRATRDWVVREDLTEVGVFRIRFNREEKDKLRRSGHGTIQEESIADVDAFRWEYTWCV